jgi:N-acetylglucosaminyldiphosphoundecaprenol N-acetyl-beta-D-mannosaminyltransferase
MNKYRTDFIGYPVDNVNHEDVFRFVEIAIKNDTTNYFAVLNANKIYLSDRNALVKKFIDQADLILPENAINIGMRILGRSLKAWNMGGLAVMEQALKYANLNKSIIYLLGATKENLDLLVKTIRIEYPDIIIGGYDDGYFEKVDESGVVEKISRIRPNFLFVGLGSPKQELFFEKHRSRIKANVALGVGGSFNVLAGLERPAPQWAKYGFEWLYRSLQDPLKFKRYFVINSYIMYKLLKALLGLKN